MSIVKEDPDPSPEESRKALWRHLRSRKIRRIIIYLPVRMKGFTNKNRMRLLTRYITI